MKRTAAPTRSVLYARVSTKDQEREGFSIPAQHKLLRQYAQEHGLSGVVKTFAVCSDAAMSQPSTRPTLYKGYRFPPEIISRCVWLYYLSIAKTVAARRRCFPSGCCDEHDRPEATRDADARPLCTDT